VAWQGGRCTLGAGFEGTPTHFAVKLERVFKQKICLKTGYFSEKKQKTAKTAEALGLCPQISVGLRREFLFSYIIATLKS